MGKGALLDSCPHAEEHRSAPRAQALPPRKGARCVSKHESATHRPVLILRDGAARLLRMRTSTVAAFFTMSNSPARSRGALLRPGFAFWLRSPQSRGGRSAERRSGACEAPVGHAVTRHVRRLRGALRPMTRDARLSALHRGGFGLPGPRFSPRYRPRLALRPAADRSQRAPRSQVVVPGGRLPCLPRRRLQAAAARRHSPLHLQDVSGDAPQ